MAFVKDTYYSPELVDDVSNLIGVVLPYETPLQVEDVSENQEETWPKTKEED